MITSTSALTFSRMYFASVPDFASIGVEESEIAVALPNADYDFFVRFTQPWHPVPFMPSADIGFVHLNRAIQHRLI